MLVKLQIFIFLISLTVGCIAQENKYTDKVFIEIDNLSDLRVYAKKSDVKVKFKPGNYQIDDAQCIRSG